MKGLGRRIVASLLVAVGATGTALFAPGLVWALRTGWNSGAAPLASTVAAAPDRRWVRLSDAVVRCETVHETARGRLALATDRAGAHTFVLPLPGRCEDARTDGVFLDDRVPAMRLKAIGLDVPDDLPAKEGVRLLVPHVDRRIVLLTLVPVAVSVLVALLGFVVVWRGRRRR